MRDLMGILIIMTLLVCGYSYMSEFFQKSSFYGWLKREIWIFRNRKNLKG